MKCESAYSRMALLCFTINHVKCCGSRKTVGRAQGENSQRREGESAKEHEIKNDSVLTWSCYWSLHVDRFHYTWEITKAWTGKQSSYVSIFFFILLQLCKLFSKQGTQLRSMWCRCWESATLSEIIDASAKQLIILKLNNSQSQYRFQS